MNTILVTGANGQLGRKIKDLSKDSKMNFIFTDIEELDISNESSIFSFCEHNNVKLFINCAAYTEVDNAEENVNKAYDINSKALKYIGNASLKYNFKIIHVSTDYVFDGLKNTPYNENDKVNPLSIYGKSKLSGEQNLININPDNSIIIRTAWLYSEYGKNFFKTIVGLGKSKDMIKVVFDQTGTPTYAGDLAEGIISMSWKLFYEGFFNAGIYHYSNQGVCSWFDFAHSILNSYKSKTVIIPVLSDQFPTKAKRPQYSVLNKSKIIDNYRITIPHWTNSLNNCISLYHQIEQ